MPLARWAKSSGFPVEVLEREDMAKLGMESAFPSARRRAGQPCRFIVMKYFGSEARREAHRAGLARA